jgi:hypothetical protein
MTTSDFNFDTMLEAVANEVHEQELAEYSLSPLRHYLLEQEPWVFVWPELVRATCDANAAILLANILRWHRSATHDPEEVLRGNHLAEVNGHDWLPKKKAAFMMETGLTPSQVDSAFKRLIRLNLIERMGRSELVRPLAQFDPPNRGTKVYARMVHMTKSGAQGLILGQMHYWFSPGRGNRARVRCKHQGLYWWADRHQDIAGKTGLSVRQIRNAIDGLKNRELIHTTTKKFSGRNHTLLRFNDSVFRARWEEHLIDWMAIQHDKRYQHHIEL